MPERAELLYDTNSAASHILNAAQGLRYTMRMADVGSQQLDMSQLHNALQACEQTSYLCA